MSKEKIPVYSVIHSFTDVEWIKNSVMVDKIEDAKIVVFPGGADVSPALYDFSSHPSTYCSGYADERDIKAYDKMNKDQLAVGICRGAQFLTVMNGGKLIQHVANHAIGTSHPIIENVNSSSTPRKTIETTSLHHQMMYPFNINKELYRVLYFSQKRSRVYEGWDLPLKGEPLHTEFYDALGEPEVVYYELPNVPKCLAIQGHPEMMDNRTAMVIEMNNIIDKILNKTFDINFYYKSKNI